MSSRDLLVLLLVALCLVVCTKAKLFAEQATCTQTIVPEGGVCTAHTDCLNGFNMCVEDNKGVKRCTPYKFKFGESCSSNDDCAVGFKPNVATKAIMECVRPNFGSGICQFSFKGYGDDCIHNSQCQSGICKNLKCSALEEFGLCGESGSYRTECGAGLYCNSGSPKQCRANPTKVGDPCDYNCYGDGVELYCKGSTDTCAEKAAIGASCDSSTYCVASAYCDSTTNLCTVKKEIGESCSGDTSFSNCEGNLVCDQGQCKNLTFACTSTSNTCMRDYLQCSCTANNANGICSSTSDNSYTLFYGTEYWAVTNCAESKCQMYYNYAAFHDVDSCVHKECSAELAEHIKYIGTTLQSMGISKIPTTAITGNPGASSSAGNGPNSSEPETSGAERAFVSSVLLLVMAFILMM